MVTWNGDADAKLCAHVLHLKDVKLTAEDKEKLSKIMDCTPKAITHRMAHLKKAMDNTGSDANDSDGTPSKKKATPKKTATPKKGAKKARLDNDEDDEGTAETPDRPKRGGAKRDYSEVEKGESEDEQVKTEVKPEEEEE